MTTPLERLAEFARTGGMVDARHDDLLRAAANHVTTTLAYLDLALIDISEAKARFLANLHLRAELRKAAGPGIRRLEGEELARSEESNQLYYLVTYRIDTFFMFARVLLDDIAVLLDRVFRPISRELGGSHSSLGTRLPRAAAEYGLTVPTSLRSEIANLDSDVTAFRDKHVAHRSRLSLRANRAVMVELPSERLAMSVGGENRTPEEPADTGDLYDRLLAYLDEVITFAELKRTTGARRARTE